MTPRLDGWPGCWRARLDREANVEVRKTENVNGAEVDVVVLVRHFGAAAAQEVEKALDQVVARGAKKILVDFSENEYIASIGLRILLATLEAVEARGDKIALCCLKPYVLKVFETAGFTGLFKIYDSEEEALKHI